MLSCVHDLSQLGFVCVFRRENVRMFSVIARHYSLGMLGARRACMLELELPRFRFFTMSMRMIDFRNVHAKEALTTGASGERAFIEPQFSLKRAK